MMLDRYDGDLALTLTLDGGNINYTSGQPQMDAGGLENVVTISLFTRNGWPGNALAGSDFGSGFEESVIAQPITPQGLRNIEIAANDALAWMIDTELAESVSVAVTAPDLNTVGIEITIDETIIFYELNWIAGLLQPVAATVR